MLLVVPIMSASASRFDVYVYLLFGTLLVCTLTNTIQHSLHTTTDHGWYFLEGFHVPEIY